MSYATESNWKIKVDESAIMERGRATLPVFFLVPFKKRVAESFFRVIFNESIKVSFNEVPLK